MADAAGVGSITILIVKQRLFCSRLTRLGMSFSDGRIVAEVTEWKIDVSLNVKDPEAHRLALAIARETGQSLTKVVIDSLRESYEKLEKRKGMASLADLMAIAKRASESVKRPYVDHGELLYDEYGLPK